MDKFIKFDTNGKQISFYDCGDKNADIVYVSSYIDSAERLLSECKKLIKKPFSLVSVCGIRWDEELSPWPSAPIVSKDDRFTGEAGEYAKFLAEYILPRTKTALEPKNRILAGYSMAGLFALYAPYVTDKFNKLVSASGSTWYPGFVSFVSHSEFLKKPEAIYLSLGDLESKSKNEYLQETENNTRELYKIYEKRGIKCTFELNSGNHFQDALHRLAKGIAWAIEPNKTI